MSEEVQSKGMPMVLSWWGNDLEVQEVSFENGRRKHNSIDLAPDFRKSLSNGVSRI